MRHTDIVLSSAPEQIIPLLIHFSDVIYLELACHQYITFNFFKSNNAIYMIIKSRYQA